MGIRYRGSGGFVASAGSLRSGGVWVPFTDTEVEPPPPTSLLGIGSFSTSLTDYPKTAPIYSGDFFVDPVNGNDSNSGTIGSPFRTLPKALGLAEEGVKILVRAGTVGLTSRIVRSTAWSTGITVAGYGTERPILNCSALGTGSAGRALYLTSSSRREHWFNFEVINAKDISVMIEGSHTKIEDFKIHHGLREGVYVANWGSVPEGYNLVQDTEVWRMGDGVSTGTNVPDLFVATASSGHRTAYNDFVRVAGANGPDDCLDLFRGRHCKVIDSVMAYAGYYWNGANAGDGNNYKMGGGDASVGYNINRGSISIGARNNGIDDNATDEGNQIINTTSVDNGGDGYMAGSSSSTIVKSNLSRDNGRNYIDFGPVADTFNSWNQGSPNPLFGNPAAFDWSLGVGSPAISAGEGGANQGASMVALEIAKSFLSRDLT